MYLDSPFFVEDAIIQQSQGQLHFAGFKRNGDDVDDDDMMMMMIMIKMLSI